MSRMTGNTHTPKARRRADLWLTHLVVGVWMLTASSLSSGAWQEKPPARDVHSLKAALVLSFCGYTIWPETSFSTQETKEARDPLIIGVWKDDRLARALKELTKKGKQIAIRTRRIDPGNTVKPTTTPRPVRVLVLEELPRPDEIHVLLIGADRRRDLDQIERLYGARPILTIGLAKGQAEQGSILSLYIENRRAAFEACRKHERRAGLELQSGLLRNARIIDCSKR